MKKYLLVFSAVMLSFPVFANTQELIDAVKKNDMPTLQKMLNSVQNINEQNEQGNTALHYAVATNNYDMVKVLLDNNADVNVENAKGWSPLEIAEKTKMTEIRNAIKEKATSDALKKQAEVVAKAKEEANKMANKIALVKTETPSKPVEVKTDVNEKLATKVASAEEKMAEVKNNVATELKEVKENIKTAVVTVGEKTTEVAQTTVEKAKELVTTNAEVETEVKTEITAEKAVAETINPIPVKTEISKETTPELKTEAKEVDGAGVKEEVKEEVKEKSKAEANPAVANPSPLSANINLGEEEIVYCLQYIGLHGENKNMISASNYYASDNGIGKERFDAIVAEAKHHFENSAEEQIKARVDECGKYITPKSAEKQNKIIRSINKAIGG